MLLGDLDRLEELVLGAPLGPLCSLLFELAEIPDVIAAGSSGDSRNERKETSTSSHVVAGTIAGSVSQGSQCYQMITKTYGLDPLVGAVDISDSTRTAEVETTHVVPSKR
jgi:hypothetical protein